MPKVLCLIPEALDKPCISFFPHLGHVLTIKFVSLMLIANLGIIDILSHITIEQIPGDEI